jgi:hypothetical protein
MKGMYSYEWFLSRPIASEQRDLSHNIVDLLLRGCIDYCRHIVLMPGRDERGMVLSIRAS